MDNGAEFGEVPKQTEKEHRPPTSTNPRVEAVYPRLKELPNREFTLPCRTRPVYESDAVRSRPDLAQVLTEHARVVVTPDAQATFPADQQSAVRVLASPYENGRVLEVDDMVDIDGKPHVISIKGVGTTRFARTTGAENPWMRDAHKSFTPDEAALLAKFPYLPDLGGLTMSSAMAAVTQSKKLQELGVDTEKILAVHEIDEMPDEHGVMRPIKYFQDKGLLPQDESAALLFRATRSNYRLLEPVVMDKIGKPEGIADFWDHALAEYAKAEGVTDPQPAEYLQWLSKKVISEHVPLILKGYQIAPGHWQDFGRNISILGERIDTGSVKKNPYIFHNPMDHFTFVKDQIGYVDTALKALTDTAYTYTNGHIDLMEYGENIIKAVDDAADATDFESLRTQFPEDQQKIYKRGEFGTMAKRALFRHFVSGRYIVGQNHALEWREYDSHMDKIVSSEKIHSY